MIVFSQSIHITDINAMFMIISNISYIPKNTIAGVNGKDSILTILSEEYLTIWVLQ